MITITPNEDGLILREALSGAAGQHLLGQQHEALVAERYAQEIVETDLVAKLQDLVADFVLCAVWDDLFKITLDRVGSVG